MQNHRPRRPTPRLFALAVLSLALGDPSALLGQSAPPLDVGSRVRVTVPGEGVRRMEGFVREIGVAGDSLVIRPDGAGQGLRRFATSDISEIDVAVEGSSRARTGLVVGLLGGAALGFGIGLAEGDDPPNTGFFKGPTFSGAEKGAIYGVVLGAVGAATGYLIGGAMTKRWERIDASTFEASLFPTAGAEGVGFAVALRWAPSLVRTPGPR